jgi:hypothetical protein
MVTAALPTGGTTWIRTRSDSYEFSAAWFAALALSPLIICRPG